MSNINTQGGLNSNSFGETQESRREIVSFQQYQDDPPVTPGRNIQTTEALNGRKEMGETSEILQPHSVHPVPQEDVHLYSEEPDQPEHGSGR